MYSLIVVFTVLWLNHKMKKRPDYSWFIQTLFLMILYLALISTILIKGEQIYIKVCIPAFTFIFIINIAFIVSASSCIFVNLIGLVMILMSLFKVKGKIRFDEMHVSMMIGLILQLVAYLQIFNDWKQQFINKKDAERSHRFNQTIIDQLPNACVVYNHDENFSLRPIISNQEFERIESEQLQEINE